VVGDAPPTAVSIFDTEQLTAGDVALPSGTATHTDLTPLAKFGFVSLVGRPQGIVVVDIDAAAIHAFYPIPDAGAVHAVRHAPGPREAPCSPDLAAETVWLARFDERHLTPARPHGLDPHQSHV